ncbi:MAG: 16S rRNA methyltransferase, partial [Chlamydiia bacterium]|nr:16S rRNA methyltransferase [Chlamydiia bacterium]
MKLLLLPNVLGPVKHHQVFLPASVDRAMETIDGLIAESEGGGRAYLKRFQLKDKPQNIPLQLLNKNTNPEDIDFMLEPCLKGEVWGVVSDAGLPCIADPGALLVSRARKLGIPIQAFVGPSSIT